MSSVSKSLMNSVTYIDIIDLLGRNSDCGEYRQFLARIEENPESFSPKKSAYVFEFFKSGFMLVVMDNVFNMACLKAKEGKYYSRFHALPAGISHSDSRSGVRSRFYTPPISCEKIGEFLTSDRYRLSDSNCEIDSNFTAVSLLAVFAVSDLSLSEVSLTLSL